MTEQHQIPGIAEQVKYMQNSKSSTTSNMLSVDDLQEQLPRLRIYRMIVMINISIKDVTEKRTDGLCCQISFECLVADMTMSAREKQNEIEIGLTSLRNIHWCHQRTLSDNFLSTFVHYSHHQQEQYREHSAIRTFLLVSNPLLHHD